MGNRFYESCAGTCPKDLDLDSETSKILRKFKTEFIPLTYLLLVKPTDFPDAHWMDGPDGPVVGASAAEPVLELGPEPEPESEPELAPEPEPEPEPAPESELAPEPRVGHKLQAVCM